jgi:cyclopropane fatty-acyl-phospholipid synthase-like methyltransferase
VLLEHLLGTSTGYRAFRSLIRADKHMRAVVSDHLRPRAGWRVLDVGCGNADLADMLPLDVRYIGIDSNPSYVRSALGRHHDVRQASVADLGAMNDEPFDAVVAIGLLHHLDDALASAFLADCQKVLRPDGRIVTVDPVRHTRQRLVTSWLLALDRGRHVRDEAGYAALFGTTFLSTHATVRHDMLPFPYSHCIVEAVRP